MFFQASCELHGNILMILQVFSGIVEGKQHPDEKGTSKGATMRILLIEDDRRLAKRIQQVLVEERRLVEVVHDGKSALLQAGGAFDCLIFDILVPGMKGIAVCRWLREHAIATPILLLTALGEVQDRVRGLDTGADDYLSKPFAFDELLARLRALERRKTPTLQVATHLHLGPLSLNLLTREVQVDTIPLALTVREFALLNVTALCTILLLLTGFLYLVEAATTDAEINRLLAHMVHQERGEDLVQIVQRPQPVIDPPRPFSPAPLQAFFLLVDTQGRVHEGAAYLLPGLPDQEALQQAWATRTPYVREITLHGVHLRLVTVPVLNHTGKPAGVIQVYVSLAGRDSELERLLLGLLVGRALGICVSALPARCLSVRALIAVQRAYEQHARFVADASHKFRPPLTLLQPHLEALHRALNPLPPFGTEGGDPLLALSRSDVEASDKSNAET